MANDNQIDFTVRINREGVGELAGDLDKVEQGAKGVGAAGAEAAKGLSGMGQVASQAGGELGELRQAVDAKTAAIKSGLQVEQSEIALQQEHLAAARTEAQARLEAAKAQGDEAAATRASNELRQIEGDRLALVARAKRAEADAVQQVADARREELTAIGPLTQAQQQELQVADNRAKSLRVQAAAVEQSAKGLSDMGQAVGKAGGELDQLRKSVDAKTAAIKAGLQAEQSEIELQHAHLTAARAGQQARLQAAQAQGDEAAATRAGNALRLIESDQLALVARAKRAEAAAVQEAVDARRSELSAIGPLTQAQANELRAAENHAKALRVEAAAADQASQRARELTQAHQGSAAATEQLGGRVQGLTQLLGQMAGALGAAFTFREFVAAAAQMEQLRSGLTAVTQDSTRAGQELEFVRVVANRIGADVTEVGKAFLGLAASTRGTAVEGEPTRQVFEAVATAMGKAGKSSAETSNALQALAQMASKGVVQSEELRGQLGEALPGALQAAAKGMGLTTEELMKLVEEGKITAQDIFPALAQGLNELYGSAPQAQTLSQEITNIKNASVDMADHLGEAGGLDALKMGAEMAQAAIVYLDDTLVTVGKTIGVVVAAITTMDFSGLKQSFADIEAESRDKLLKAAQHNSVLRASIETGGTEAMKAALAQQQLGNATQQAAAAGAEASPTWVKVASDYGKVIEAITEQIAATEKSVIARDAEGKAAVALAQAFGTEAQQRQAQADAAAANAQAQQQLAQLKTTELEAMKAELAALQALAAQQGPLDAQRQKQLQELEKKIALAQQDVDKTQAQAQAARLHAELTQAQTQALQDNSGRVKELRDAWENARLTLDALNTEKRKGKATSEQVTEAELAAGKAALLYRDALNDQQRAIAAKAQVQQASNSLEQATVRLAIEQQRAAYEVAKAKGDESGAMRAQNEIRKLEIELLGLVAQAKRAEAQAALASIAAKRAELEASGSLTETKRLELDAAEKAAQVKIKEAQIAETTAKKVKDLANAHTELGASAGGSVGGINSATSAMGRQADQLEKLQRIHDRYRMSTSEESTKAVQDARDTHTGNVQVLPEIINAEVARRLGEEFVGNRVAERVVQLRNEVEQYNKYGGPRTREGAAEANAKRQELERAEAELEVERNKLNAQRSSTAGDGPGMPLRGAGDRGAGDGSRSSNSTPSSANSGAGVAYISNITLPSGQRATVRFADADSQATNERLLRDLAAAKGVAQ